jgi:serine/threonine protein phosphatase 1
MIAALRPFLRARSGRAAPALPAGERIYAIGDIHGRRDLLESLIGAIEADDAASVPAETTVILLGDLVDRGADSAGVIAAARAWGMRRRVRIVAGNHEEMFLQCFSDRELMRAFLRFGGRETVLSYPVDATRFALADVETAQAMMREAVPAADLEFIRGFEDRILIGDYLFVHAGVRPGVALDDQLLSDLRWIRAEFTESRRHHGVVVVHGHTITDQVEIRGNRIGIDTGAFASGKLTALRLEGTARHLLETRETDEGVAVEMRSIP